MFFFMSRRRVLSVVFLTFCFSVTDLKWAKGGSFQLEPIRITLSAKNSSALLTLRNDSGERTRFQIGVYGWDQNRQGEMVLRPTEDLIFYPQLLALDPGDQRKVRVGTNNSVVSLERAYRIFVEELPPADKQEKTGIRILTKMGVPIFIQPAQTKVLGRIEQMTVVQSEFSFAIKNSGNVHFLPSLVRVRGTDAQGEGFLERELRAWYILAGGSREYRVEVPREHCRKIEILTVEVQLEEKSLQEKFRLPANACGS